MNRIAVIVSLSLAIELLSAFARAEAQPSPPPVTKTTSLETKQPSRARDLFEQGLNALKEGNLIRARQLLEASLELERSAPGAFNLAVSLRGLGKPVEALNHLRSLERGEFGEVSPTQRAELGKLIATVNKETSQVRVEAGCVDDIVEIDDKQLLRQNGRWSATLNPGTYVVRVKRFGKTIRDEGFDAIANRTKQIMLGLCPKPDEGGDALPWVVGGVAVAAALAGVLLYVALAPDNEGATVPLPESNLFGTAQALRF